jgi:predicted transglutaminase-like cysteine proteinase
VFGVLSWMLVASVGTLLITAARIAFGFLPYAQGKYVLVLAAFGVVATIEAFGFTARRGIMLLVVLSIATHSSPAHAGPFLRTGENALAPMAFTVFCLKYPADCEPQAIPNERPALTNEQVQELVTVNTLVNRSIKPEPNLGGLPTERWLLYPTSGECHDYAVTKRHELMARAWPGSLLIAVVIVPSGEWHAVLVVPTDRGDLVLDNLRYGIVRWDVLRYQWLKIMSPENPKFWRHIVSWLWVQPRAILIMRRFRICLPTRGFISHNKTPVWSTCVCLTYFSFLIE